MVSMLFCALFTISTTILPSSILIIKSFYNNITICMYLANYSTYVNRLMNCPAGTVPPLEQPNTVTWLKDLAMEDYSIYADKLSQRVGIDPTVPFDSTINNPHIKLNDSNNPKMEYESLDNVPLVFWEAVKCLLLLLRNS